MRRISLRRHEQGARHDHHHAPSADRGHDPDRCDRRRVRCPAGTPEPTPTGGSEAFTNPVVDANVPDPMIIADDEGGWWAFATNGKGPTSRPCAAPISSPGSRLADALPELPAWTAGGDVWAPEVARTDDGRWLMYYTTPAPSGPRRHPVHRTGDRRLPGRSVRRLLRSAARLRDRRRRVDRRAPVHRTRREALPVLEERRQPDRRRHLDLGAATGSLRHHPGRQADEADQAGPALGGRHWSRRLSWWRRAGRTGCSTRPTRTTRQRTPSGWLRAAEPDRAVRQAARPGPGQQRGSRGTGALRDLRGRRPAVDGLPRLAPGRRRLRRSRAAPCG